MRTPEFQNKLRTAIVVATEAGLPETAAQLKKIVQLIDEVMSLQMAALENEKLANLSKMH